MCRHSVPVTLLEQAKAEEGIRQIALANLDLESAPWNARSIRSHFLRRFGVVVARGVGASLVRAKWEGRVLLRARGLLAPGHPSVRPFSGPARSAWATGMKPSPAATMSLRNLEFFVPSRSNQI